MKVIFAMIFALCCVTSALGITIETVPVGDVGNPNDPADGDEVVTGVQNFGAVDYAYNIGKYEVTVGQYAAFLNAVAATDTYSLYDTSMATNTKIACISRSGASGSYSYSVIGSANHPITEVSWGDAARFCNWLNNGQPTGAQDANSTEDGAYTLNGAVSNTALNAVPRNANAIWFIPTENEWYKAAYYQPYGKGGDADSYWEYPMKTNSVPYSDQPPGVTPDNTRVGNFYRDDGVANGYDDGYGATGTQTYQNYLTDVGAYTSSPSYYGTFDQGGNVDEWNEYAPVFSTPRRGVRSGPGFSDVFNLRSRSRGNHQPAFGNDGVGFRVASIPVTSGDFNGDGAVDAADYILWRKSPANFGNAAGYSAWRSRIGQGTGNGTGFYGTVPEPSTAILAVSIFATLAGIRRRCG